MISDKEQILSIIDKYLVLIDGEKDGWNCQKLVLKWPDIKSELLILGEGSSMEYTRGATRNLLYDMITEIVKTLNK